MAELRGVERLFEVHSRSELEGAIRKAARCGGRIEVDEQLHLKPWEVTYAEMKAGFHSPRHGYKLDQHPALTMVTRQEIDGRAAYVQSVNYAPW